ncbi:MAG TPA: DUF1302 family protein [Vicinamibacterales bacterium]|nr:DUF1302 family protein [Vicinamibacterales bacterium]
MSPRSVNAAGSGFNSPWQDPVASAFRRTCDGCLQERLREFRRRFACVAIFVVLAPAGAAAQGPTGHVAVFLDYVPNRDDTVELRSRVFLEESFEPAANVRVRASGFAEGLLARRPERVTTGILRVQDASVEWRRGPLDLTAGFARVVWGTLDEVQPTDVVNPLDVSRFFFEGRNEARLPVALVRGRWYPSASMTVEGIYVPVFRRGRFDQLDEPTSPFNLAELAAPAVPCAGEACGPTEVAIVEREPAVTLRNAQGGARVTVTAGRADLSVIVYRGFEPFALYRLPPQAVPAPVLEVETTHPRFTLIGADFETVRGPWAMRAEVAATPEGAFQSFDVTAVPGRSFEAGAGIDRRAGAYTISGTVLFQRESYDEPLVRADGTNDDGRQDVSFIGSADRTFARERFRLRTFGLYNATERTTFLRVIATTSLRDNLTLEASVGWFAGTGEGFVGRYSRNDFGYLRLRHDF